jgi:hypothetical protein
MLIQALPYMGASYKPFGGKCSAIVSGMAGPPLVSFTVRGPNLAQVYTGTIKGGTTYVSLALHGAGPYSVTMGLTSMSAGQLQTVYASNAVVTYIPVGFPSMPGDSVSFGTTMIARVPEGNTGTESSDNRDSEE